MHDPLEQCAKCHYFFDGGFIWASVDLGAVLCGNCLDDFNEWCNTHPNEPYGNFLQPKPWKIPQKQLVTR